MRVVRQRRRWARCAAAAWLAFVALGARGADAFPSQPITLVVPFAPGGYTDVVARVLAENMSPALGQPVVIVNRPGAGSTIGTNTVAKAKPDGYTIGLVSMSLVIGPFLYKPLPYDPVKDLVPIGLVADAASVLVVNPQVPAKTVQEFVALAREKPNTLGYASSGNGSTQQLIGAMFASMSGVRMNHIPYRGSNQSLIDVIGGQVASSFVGVPNALSNVKAGRLRALAVTTSRRSDDLPDVPTMQEAGLAGFDVAGWLGLVAPVGTPPDAIDRIRTEAAKALSSPAGLRALRSAGVNLHLSDGPTFARLLHTESERWEKVVAESGVRID